MSSVSVRRVRYLLSDTVCLSEYLSSTTALVVMGVINIFRVNTVCQGGRVKEG